MAAMRLCTIILSIWHGPVQQVAMGNFCGSANSIRPYQWGRDVPLVPKSDLALLKKTHTDTEDWQKYERQKEAASQRELRWKTKGRWGGGCWDFMNVFCCLYFFLFHSHGVADTLESYEVCCSGCVHPVIGQVQHGDMERDGKAHGLKEHTESALPLRKLKNK